jgi:hypothetical protein
LKSSGESIPSLDVFSGTDLSENIVMVDKLDYQQYVFGYIDTVPKTFIVGIVTLNGFSFFQNVLKP